jgi:glycosyltransferase involved in cell wall biosynthesis
VIDCAKNSCEVNNIQIFENVSQAKLVNLYDHCEALVFPSLSEGFGLALVEVVARGKNVICSDIKIFREIMQDGAIYFDPLVAEDITRAMLEYSNLNLEQKNQLQIRVVDATKNFSWKNTAKLIASKL